MREYGTVVVDNLHLRHARKKGQDIGDIAGYLKRGDDFEVIGPPDDQKENRWLPVKVKHTGQVGYVAQKRHDGTKVYVMLWREAVTRPQLHINLRLWAITALVIGGVVLALVAWF